VPAYCTTINDFPASYNCDKPNDSRFEQIHTPVKISEILNVLSRESGRGAVKSVASTVFSSNTATFRSTGTF
jgi:hypothetical protein